MLLNHFVINEIVYIMRKNDKSEKLCDQLRPYNILKEKMFEMFKKRIIITVIVSSILEQLEF